MDARPPLTLDAEGILYLEPNEWVVTVSYRFLHSERPFIGEQEPPELHARAGRIEIHSTDLGATYAITKRFSGTLTLPFVFSTRSIFQDDNQRREGSSAGLGDIRLVGNAWVFDPETHPRGNVSFSLGIKPISIRSGVAQGQTENCS